MNSPDDEQGEDAGALQQKKSVTQHEGETEALSASVEVNPAAEDVDLVKEKSPWSLTVIFIESRTTMGLEGLNHEKTH